MTGTAVNPQPSLVFPGNAARSKECWLDAPADLSSGRVSLGHGHPVGRRLLLSGRGHDYSSEFRWDASQIRKVAHITM
jgi:hypothetical protein